MNWMMPFSKNLEAKKIKRGAADFLGKKGAKKEAEDEETEGAEEDKGKKEKKSKSKKNCRVQEK